jgi:hypothetical protein
MVLKMGLSLVAVDQAMIINPGWMARPSRQRDSSFNFR